MARDISRRSARDHLRESRSILVKDQSTRIIFSLYIHQNSITTRDLKYFWVPWHIYFRIQLAHISSELQQSDCVRILEIFQVCIRSFTRNKSDESSFLERIYLIPDHISRVALRDQSDLEKSKNFPNNSFFPPEKNPILGQIFYSIFTIWLIHGISASFLHSHYLGYITI